MKTNFVDNALLEKSLFQIEFQLQEANSTLLFFALTTEKL